MTSSSIGSFVLSTSSVARDDLKLKTSNLRPFIIATFWKGRLMQHDPVAASILTNRGDASLHEPPNDRRGNAYKSSPGWAGGVTTSHLIGHQINESRLPVNTPNTLSMQERGYGVQ